MVRAEQHGTEPPPRPRFLTRGMCGAIALYLLALLTYAQPRLANDGLWYLAFIRRLFGEQSDGVAYQFGVAFWNAPWFLLARAAESLGVSDVHGLPLEDLAIAVGAAVAVLLLFPLGWRLLRELRLDHAPRAVL